MESGVTENFNRTLPPAIRLLVNTSSMDDDLSPCQPEPILKGSLSESTSSLQLKKENERRNSVSSLLSFQNRTRATSERQGSVPNISITQSRIIGRQTSNSLHCNNSKYRSLRLYQYLANKGDQSSNSSSDQQLSKLEDALTNIRSQLNNLTKENRSMRDRIVSLSEAVTDLTCRCSPPKVNVEIVVHDTTQEQLTVPYCSKTLPIERVHSQPPLLNGWGSRGESSEDSSDESEKVTSQESNQLDWLVKVESGVNLIGMDGGARVPCIILVEDDNSESDIEEKEEMKEDKMEEEELDDDDDVFVTT